MKQLYIERSQYSKSFLPLLESNHRYLISFGGRGSGKTHHIILKLLSLTFMKSYVNIVYCRHEKTTLRDTTFRDIINYIKNSKYKDCFEYSEAYNSSMIFTNKLTGKQLLPFGLDDVDKTKGISEVTHIWIDEVDKCTEKQVTMINSVLRTSKAKVLQLILSFNPVNDKHWLRTFFFSEEDAYKAHERFSKTILIHHSTVRDNEYIDVEEYIKTLRLNYAHNPALLDVNLNGLWGVTENKSPFFYAFRHNHIIEQGIEWNRQLPIYLGFDFNIDPMTCVVAQFLEGQFLAFIKSYKINDCTIKELCIRIKTDFPNALFLVTADPAGGARSAGYDSVNTTMHSIIKRELQISSHQLFTPQLNWTRSTAWTELRVTCNTVLQNHPRVMFSKDECTDLINDIQIATTEEGKDKLYKTSGNTEYGMHLADGFIYILTTWFNKWVKKAS